MRKGLAALLMALLMLMPMAMAMELTLSEGDIDYLNSLIEDGLPEYGFIVVEWPDEEEPLTLTTDEICATWSVKTVVMGETEIDATNMGLSKKATFTTDNAFTYTSDGTTVTGTWEQNDDQFVHVTLDDGGTMEFAFNYDHDIELVEDTAKYIFGKTGK